MTTKLSTGAIAGVGTLGLAMVGSTVAVAAPGAAGCGDTPVGGEVTRTGDICQVDFSSSGSYSWTVPQGLTGLYAVLTGGGGGAWVAGSNGYAGTGGDVVYVDLTAAATQPTAQIVVGSGGVSSGQPSSGADTTLELGAISAVATGGSDGATFTHYCIVEGNYSVYTGNGDGAGGPAGTMGDPCDETFAPGVAPASGNDSLGESPMSAFSTFSETLGAGGRVLTSPESQPVTLDPQPVVDGTGRGADVLYATDDESLTATHDGGDGRVVLRFAALAGEAGADELADTGAEVGALVGAAGALGLAGAFALMIGRRRAQPVAVRR